MCLRGDVLCEHFSLASLRQSIIGKPFPGRGVIKNKHKKATEIRYIKNYLNMSKLNQELETG